MSKSKFGAIGDMHLQLGGALRDTQLAYVTYGKLDPDGRNAVLLVHGYTSSHLFVESEKAGSEDPWSNLVGRGLPIDTDRYYVVSTNMIGSSYGSTAPRSINPETGKPYGPDFPLITLEDIVTAQRKLLHDLGVTQLVAVAGPSYGGFQALAWGIEFPDFVRGLVLAVTGLNAPATIDIDALRADLTADANWNDGSYYEFGGLKDTMAAMRERMLRAYGIATQLIPNFPDAGARNAEIRRIATVWADTFDANSLLALGDAMKRFDPSSRLDRIKAKVLYVLSSSDILFPPSISREVMASFSRAGVDARYFEISGLHGHLASGADAAKWSHELRRFLGELGV